MRVALEIPLHLPPPEEFEGKRSATPAKRDYTSRTCSPRVQLFLRGLQGDTILGKEAELKKQDLRVQVRVLTRFEEFDVGARFVLMRRICASAL